jgi:hypothetical protein
MQQVESLVHDVPQVEGKKDLKGLEVIKVCGAMSLIS